jgi:desulfoferrodoxin (superoxide reductase-like protein)
MARRSLTRSLALLAVFVGVERVNGATSNATAGPLDELHSLIASNEGGKPYTRDFYPKGWESKVDRHVPQLQINTTLVAPLVTVGVAEGAKEDGGSKTDFHYATTFWVVDHNNVMVYVHRFTSNEDTDVSFPLGLVSLMDPLVSIPSNPLDAIEMDDDADYNEEVGEEDDAEEHVSILAQVSVDDIADQIASNLGDNDGVSKENITNAVAASIADYYYVSHQDEAGAPAADIAEVSVEDVMAAAVESALVDYYYAVNAATVNAPVASDAGIGRRLRDSKKSYLRAYMHCTLHGVWASAKIPFASKVKPKAKSASKPTSKPASKPASKPGSDASGDLDDDLYSSYASYILLDGGSGSSFGWGSMNDNDSAPMNDDDSTPAPAPSASKPASKPASKSTTHSATAHPPKKSEKEVAPQHGDVMDLQEVREARTASTGASASSDPTSQTIYSAVVLAVVCGSVLLAAVLLLRRSRASNRSPGREEAGTISMVAGGAL